MIVLYLIFGFTLLVLVLFPFLSDKISPVPYFPSNKRDISLILQALGLKNKKIIVDIGAGDGLVIFAAAQEALKRKSSTTFVAIELNPILILILHMRRLLHPNRQNIRILRADMFTLDYSQLATDNRQPITCYIYISPWLIPKLVSRLKKKLGRFTLVSYYYPVLKQKPLKKVSGLHHIFIYKILPAA